MSKPGIQRTPADRLIFVAEILVDPARHPSWIDLVLSIAGRESTFTRRWQLTNGLMDSNAASDLSVAVAASTMDAIIMLCGVQEVLPMSL